MRDITLCHPRLQALATELIKECAKQGLQIKISETLRTVAEQDALYAQGRTKPGKKVTNAPGSSFSSYHQWGTAFDIYRADGKTLFTITMDFSARSAQSGYPSAWNGAGIGNPSQINLTSSSPTGDHQRVESRRFTRLRNSS